MWLSDVIKGFVTVSETKLNLIKMYGFASIDADSKLHRFKEYNVCNAYSTFFYLVAVHKKYKLKKKSSMQWITTSVHNFSDNSGSTYQLNEMLLHYISFNQYICHSYANVRVYSIFQHISIFLVSLISQYYLFIIRLYT